LAAGKTVAAGRARDSAEEKDNTAGVGLKQGVRAARRGGRGRKDEKGGSIVHHPHHCPRWR